MRYLSDEQIHPPFGGTGTTARLFTKMYRLNFKIIRHVARHRVERSDPDHKRNIFAFTSSVIVIPAKAGIWYSAIGTHNFTHAFILRADSPTIRRDR
jgi:hypothetical protein